ncbi:heavy-metal-associated domain-containing protein, partial [Ilumatobacter sp.]|nr:heavy-metal-associated domain-containing protein [Ilumatobacter sp.]
MTDQLLDRQQILDLDVDGMTCGSCAARIQKTLAKQPGITHADVNFATGRARVSVDDTVNLA